MDYDGFLELVKKRRSNRSFKPDPIPDDYADKIIEAARWAPSGFNTQPWDFAVVKKQELKDSIVQLLEEKGGVPRRPMDYSNAPVFIILLGDPRTKIGLPPRLSTDYEKNQPIYISSLASAFLSMHLAATALGLASQWMTHAGFQVQVSIKELLGVPEGFEIYDMMAVGYPAVKARPKPVRAWEKMVHYDYSSKEDFRTDEEVNDFAGKTRDWMYAGQRRPD